MVWVQLADGVIVPSGRIPESWIPGDTGRVALWIPDADPEDAEYRGTIEITEELSGLAIYGGIIRRVDAYSITTLLEMPPPSASMRITLAFPFRARRFAGLYWALFTEYASEA